MFGEFIHNCKPRIQTRKKHENVYLSGSLTDDGRQGQLLVVDYRGKADALCLKIDGMDGATATAEILDHEHNRTPATLNFADGTMKLHKNGPGSAAFLVTLKRS